MKIVIIDYGVGNIKSIQNQLIKLGYNSSVSSEKTDIINADKLILPGVGHFAYGMKTLNELDLLGTLKKKVIIEKTPILGICLGMQLFTEWSEEGNVSGLGWIKGKAVKFTKDPNKRYKIPHMGWNSIKIKKQNKMIRGIKNDSLFYFVHSFYVECSEDIDILTTTKYISKFASMIQKENIYGTQFHPEKSHENGLQILKNFAEYA
ncbi:MAG: imidazole glycerol phosphate synthase subunit HisH [Candidatus Aenigmarchaeota archaeon]|nr:imidazole glycerol phosphate synthase subunit HisH [Candidatus Aenigmarchaeota archaeon]